MQIVNAKVHCTTVNSNTLWVFLTLTTETGLIGTGEALLGGGEDTLLPALQFAANKLLAADLFAAAPPPATLADDQSTGLLEATVRSTIDQCLWDLRAQAAGLPLFRLLGPASRTEIPLYANINRGTFSRRPHEFAERAAAAVEEGFRGIKLAPFDDVTRGSLQTPDGQQMLAAGIDRVKAVRDAIGFQTMLMVDCHCRLDLAAALRFVDAIAPLRLDWFEDPLPYHDIAGWERLKTVCRVPLIGGETARGIRDLLPFMQRGIWDVVMPDVRFFGGISELVALAPLATQLQIAIAPHNPRGPIGTLASAQAMAAGGPFTLLEYQWGECAWRNDLVAGAEVIDNGHLTLPSTPGIGAQLRPAMLTAHSC